MKRINTPETLMMIMMMVMMMMMMMNSFCDMVDRQKAFSLISSKGPLSEILSIANLCHTVSKV